ncbi:MAG: hypothetical protein LBB13_00445 [Rickettsiales bacterium]|jgi:thymidine kinase|nr:hypothetical protein [Rickettsiales bacterium]
MDSGKIIFFTGCMFAGKSLSLIEKVQEIGKPFEGFKPLVDTRDGAFIASRNSTKKLAANMVDDISMAMNSVADVVVFDEIQFFKTEGFEEVIGALKDRGKIVLMSGLDRIANGDYWKIYPIALDLSDEVVYLSAICDLCGKTATFTKRLEGGNEEIQIEGEGVRYIPTCEHCFRLK